MKHTKGIVMSLVLMPLMALAGSDLYMVVDLSGGTNATSYGISYLSDVPEGGWTDEYKTTKLVLRRIEPGTCVVTTDKPYYIGVFEVTQKQYELITGETPSYFSGNDKRPVEQVSYDMIRGTNKGAQYPDSTDVDDDSVMGKLRARTAIRFDLPTEIQWEYACRAGTTTAYSYGDRADDSYMWYASNSGSCSHEVGTRNPNGWGFYDMHGNVWEWCLDWYTVGSMRMVRGGSWSTRSSRCTSSHREDDYPSFVYSLHGFRLCCAAPSTMIFNVIAQQRYPWNGKVDISYSVSGIEAKAKEEGLIATLKVSAIDLTTSTTNIATTLSGDVSLADGTHKIVWDMNADGLTFKSTNVVFNVSFETEKALYCIVDLSAGADATSYPVSYTNEIPGGSWSDEYKTTKLVMRRIEPGICVVTVDEPYYVGVFEVTQKQYELLTGTAPSYFSGNDMRPVECVSYSAIRGSNKGALYPDSTDVDDDSCVGKLRNRTGMHFDLPTEAQWEYACRAGTTTTYSYGDTANGDYMWYDSNSGSCTHDVGTCKANPWGLYDMHGNVWEWSLEWYPECSGLYRVLRGGSWHCFAVNCTSSDLGRNHSSSENEDHGFRFVRTLSDSAWSPCKGESSACNVDLTVGTRTAAKMEVLNYSTEWVDDVGENATAVIAVDGTTLSEQEGCGTVEWTPTRNGTYELTHKVMEGGEQVGETLTATFVVEGICPDAPVIKPMSGTTFETTSLTVSMTCASEGATIHYTTDGSVPTMESATYKKFKIYGKTTVKAIAFYDDGAASEMAVAEYARGTCEEPTVTPKDGSTFDFSEQVVTLKHENPEGVLRYTTDGSEPTSESAEYTGPFTIDETTTIKAKVFGDQYFDSAVVTATLTRVWLKVATPEITAQAQFTGSKQKVVIGCATDGALVRYTTNGADPNSHSTKYKGPFYVTDTTTVKAYATKADYTNSDIGSLVITKAWGIGDTMGKPDHAFTTSGDAEFVRVEDATATLGESMKSGEIDHEEKSVLSTKVMGPGTLTFKWKTSCEQDDEYEWDHAEFAVDGNVKKRLNGITDWVTVSQRIEGEGEHTVTWTYMKDDVEKQGEDCVWVADYAWASDYTTTQTTATPVPYAWLTEKCPDVVDEYESYEGEAKKTAANPRFTVEQCYVAGLDPESTTNEFSTAIEMVDGLPVITWTPDLNEGGAKSERAYKIWGSTNLVNGGDWEWPTNALHRFFKVTVEMP